ncbi:MAG: hypothetical protein D3916_02910 [Candidatus Electrothrix sp. MAN1_4]|nr:hypothetical protein [Candidatus Electrothrix sp. MAN1_4]
MADEIIEELWKIKDSIARDHAYSVEDLVAHLKAKGLSHGQNVADLQAMKNKQCDRLDCKPSLNAPQHYQSNTHEAKRADTGSG